MKKTAPFLLPIALLALGLSLGGASPARAESGNRIGAEGGIEFGLGSMKSTGGTYPSRTMDSVSFYAMPGYHIGMFMPGIFFEYRLLGQITDPATVGNTNTKGHGTLFGLGGSVHYSDFLFSLGIGFLGQYSFSKNNINQQSVTYQSPFGIKLLAGYHVYQHLYASFGFETISHSQISLAGASGVDSSSDKLQETSYRIGATVDF